MTRDQLKQLLDSMVDLSGTTIRKQQFGAIVAACKSGLVLRDDCKSLCEDYDFCTRAFRRLTGGE